jgi:hypothetical protein
MVKAGLFSMMPEPKADVQSDIAELGPDLRIEFYPSPSSCRNYSNADEYQKMLILVFPTSVDRFDLSELERSCWWNQYSVG